MNLRDALRASFATAKSELLAAVVPKAEFHVSGVELFSYEDDYFVVKAFYDTIGPDGGEEYIASFKMRSALQCGAIGVPYHIEVAEKFRGLGVGKILERVRIKAARAAGYQLMLATTRADNGPQVHIMREAGWQFVRQFHNPSTGHEVILWLLAFEPCCECGGPHDCDDCPTFVGEAP